MYQWGDKVCPSAPSSIMPTSAAAQNASLLTPAARFAEPRIWLASALWLRTMCQIALTVNIMPSTSCATIQEWRGVWRELDWSTWPASPVKGKPRPEIRAVSATSARLFSLFSDFFPVIIASFSPFQAQTAVEKEPWLRSEPLQALTRRMRNVSQTHAAFGGFVQKAPVLLPSASHWSVGHRARQ
jgi:hypothetical protein